MGRKNAWTRLVRWFAVSTMAATFLFIGAACSDPTGPPREITFTVDGQVTLSDTGAPLPHALVRLVVLEMDFQTGVWSFVTKGSGRTDADGRYAVTATIHRLECGNDESVTIEVSALRISGLGKTDCVDKTVDILAWVHPDP